MELARVIKIYLHTTPDDDKTFTEVAERYASACSDVSQYVFDHGFILNTRGCTISCIMASAISSG